MVDLQWVAPPGWPAPSPGYVPDSRFRPDVEQLPPIPPGWDFWVPAGGATDYDKREFVRVGFPRRAVRIWQQPPQPPEHATMRWVAPPGWPPTPSGWIPPANWKRPRGWPKEPPGWAFWQIDTREHDAAISQWRSDRDATFDHLTQTRLGMAMLLNYVESMFTLRCAQAQLIGRPIPAFAYFVGGDIPAPERTAQRQAHEDLFAALGELRVRMLAVARGNYGWREGHVPDYATHCGELAARADTFDQNCLDLALAQMTSALRNATPTKAKPKQLALARSVLDAGRIALEQGKAQFDAAKRRAETWAGQDSDLTNGHIGSWQDAESVAAAHMREALGFSDASTTGAGTDNGIDVASLFAVAQVKHLSAAVGQPDVQRLVGANEGRKTMLFYSSSGYSRQAVDYADRAGVALFRFEPPGAPVPIGLHAQRLVDEP